MRLPYGETVTVTRPPARDKTGDQIGSSTTTTVPGCAFAWNNVTEDNGFRETSIVLASLYIPVDADVVATDRVTRASGEKFDVIGPPQWDQAHPMTGWQPGYKVVQMRAVK